MGRRFDYLWATFAVSSLGDGLGYGAVPLLALFVNPHPLPVASVAAADTFPWLVLALPAGALADRFERGRLMAVTNFGRALVLVTLALLVASGRINLPLLILLVFVNGGARAIYYSASQATVPELVEPALVRACERVPERHRGRHRTPRRPDPGNPRFRRRQDSALLRRRVGGRGCGPVAAGLSYRAPDSSAGFTARSWTAPGTS